jgi:hypothetical protein
MIGTLYRYQHPNDPTKFIYVGQGPKRDKEHRSGKSSFGRRFKKLFPDDILPEPIKEQIEVYSTSELNEEETIWMFRYHTWWGYPDGMNLGLPGSSDYKNIGKIAGQMAVESGQVQSLGKKQGRKNVENGHLASIRTPENISKGTRRRNEIYGNPSTPESCARAGRIGGRKHVESGHIQALGKIQGYIICCLRWNIRRGKPCTCGKHL